MLPSVAPEKRNNPPRAESAVTSDISLVIIVQPRFQRAHKLFGINIHYTLGVFISCQKCCKILKNPSKYHVQCGKCSKEAWKIEQYP